jgi:hypothetical protein
MKKRSAKSGEQTTEAQRHRGATFNIQHSTFNIQHSTFNIQHSMANIQRPRAARLRVGCRLRLAAARQVRVRPPWLGVGATGLTSLGQVGAAGGRGAETQGLTLATANLQSWGIEVFPGGFPTHSPAARRPDASQGWGRGVGWQWNPRASRPGCSTGSRFPRAGAINPSRNLSVPARTITNALPAARRRRTRLHYPTNGSGRRT